MLNLAATISFSYLQCYPCQTAQLALQLEGSNYNSRLFDRSGNNYNISAAVITLTINK